MNTLKQSIMCFTLTLVACLAGQGFAQESELHFARVVKVEIDGKTLEAELSPDESKIVFSTRAKRSNDIFVANADGSNPIQLCENSTIDFEPCWSPDGERIMFCSMRTGQFQIFEMAADGTDVRQLTDEPNGVRHPRYSSSGWVSWQVMHPREGKIYPCDLVATRGEEQRMVTKSANYVADYAWSPDGEKICYGTAGHLVFYELDSGERTVIDLKGTDDRLFGHSANHITWSPESDRIACRITFFGGRAAGIGGGEMPEIFGDKEFFVVNPDDQSIEVIEPDALNAFPLEWVRERFEDND